MGGCEMNNDAQNALSLLPLIDRRHADDTSAWQSICIALKNCGVPYEVFEQWSLTDRYRDRKQIRRAWENLRGGHTIGTLIHYAKLDGGNVSYVCTCAKPGSFDGDRAFAAIIAPYAECSVTDLECELWERSPYRLDDECGEGDFLALLGSLYDPDDLIFVGDPKVAAGGQRQCIRSVKEHLASPCLAEFFRPNPLTGLPVARENGRPSFVCDACVAKFRYAVLEFDHRDVREQCAFFLAMLDKGFPIAALTHSGNKSIHCLLSVNCADASEWESEVEEQLFRAKLEPLGCDRACKNESRSSRTPGARRANGKMQRLLYLNPNMKGN